MKRTIVCLCGSTRFWKHFQEANYRETMAGRIVLTVGFYPHTSQQRMILDGGKEERIINVVHNETVGCTPEEKVKLDELHFDKIEMSDEVLILNVDGYVGESTRREYHHAKKHGKIIRWLEPNKAIT